MRHLVLIVLALGLGLASSRAMADDGWPREVRAGGYVVTMFQPQIEAFSGDVRVRHK